MTSGTNELGDVRKESLKNIWNSEEMFAHQSQHLLGKRKQNPICATCGQLSHCRPDNIDSFAGKLLKKLIASRGR